jgi:hypothetical protein
VFHLGLRTPCSLPKPPFTLEDPRAGDYSDPIEPVAVHGIEILPGGPSERLASPEAGIAGRRVCVELPELVAYGWGMGVALSDFRKMVTIGDNWNVGFAPKNCLA